MAFNLSDSFYHVIKKVDAVALELNPELWQAQMIRMNTLNENYAAYVTQPGNDYLNENSFRISRNEDLIKAALSSEPPVVNSLLYRSYKLREDFEEDTFLDLYIFQTGRKLGKAAAGVEDYYESEKLVLEAYADMAREKKKKEVDLDGETMASMLEKLQNAYRRGDLDLMDSIDNVMEKSPAFREKFLFKRNQIQADAIDSIIRKQSLFAGVGAAHLPGKRGVIEMLRAKGYKLRPILMSGRDAAQKDIVEKMKVKVNFTTEVAGDGMFSVDVPGKLYSLKSSYVPLNRWQYADMNNGAYYLVTRVKTYGSFLSFSEENILKKVDSLLYENIPGKIISKKPVINNGYAGMEIQNKTRRGDLQRYQVYATPFELIIFKMSGKGEYILGEEAARFFSSIRLKPTSNGPVQFKPLQGGFSMLFPHEPHQHFDNISEDRWEYEAKDKSNGDAYLLIKKSNYNFNFIEEDSFDLGLVEESFRNPELFGASISRKQGSLNGAPALYTQGTLKTGHRVFTVYFLKGPHYFVLSRRASNAADTSFDFTKNFKWESFVYGPATEFTDTFLRVSMKTPVQPQLDGGMRSIIEQTALDAANGNNYSGYISYWQKQKNASLRSDSTGEMIAVQVQEYPKYFYIRDSAKFWKTEIEDFLNKKDMVLRNSNTVSLGDGSTGYHITLQDTGSSRMIERLIFLKGNQMYTLSAVSDTMNMKSEFMKKVFETINPVPGKSSDIYKNKLPLFFEDLFSKDSAIAARAQQSVSNIYFGASSVNELYNAIKRIPSGHRDYFNIKSKLIAELGYIRDDEKDVTPPILRKIYSEVADTTIFQNEVVKALARLRTRASFRHLGEILLQDPPVFDENDHYENLFESLEDTLQISKALFPGLFRLSSLPDYREHVTKLMVQLVDSGYIRGKDYKDYYSSIYIDAKVALKKQQVRDEKQLQAERKNQDNDDEDVVRAVDRFYNGSNRYSLYNYAVLLVPFYDDEANVRDYFSRLLKTTDKKVKLDAAILLLRNNKRISHEIIDSLAADETLRLSIYQKLEKINKLDLFPSHLKNQQEIARSILVAEANSKVDSVSLIEKRMTTAKGRTGYIYFYRYRLKKNDDWKIGISGIQPLDNSKISSRDDIVSLTDKKIKDYEPLKEQLDAQLKIFLYSFHKSSRNFFNPDNYMNKFRSLNDLEDEE